MGDFEHLPAHIIDSTKATIFAVASPSFIHYPPLCEGGEDARWKTLDVTSWKDVALNASEDVLLDSIRSHDVEELEWKEVCAEQTVQCFVLYEAGC